MTGRALVITRLSSVAMNIGTEAASRVSQTGITRAARAAGDWVRQRTVMRVS